MREILAGSGVPDDRFASVTGKADTEPLFPDNPYLAANRRVTVTLLKEAPPKLILTPNLPMITKTKMTIEGVQTLTPDEWPYAFGPDKPAAGQ